MTIEELIVQCLYEYKTVTIQQIGTFSIAPEVVLENESGKEADLPKGSISFTENKQAVEDIQLIDFITLHTRKMKFLASSDMESYVMLQKQFLNIGKPLIIPGLGSLHKDQQGNYIFSEGKLIAKNAVKAVEMKESSSTDNIIFKTAPKQATNKTSQIVGVAVVLLILLCGAALYYYFNQRKEAPVATTTVAPIDTTKLTVQKDSLPAVQPAVAKEPSDSSAYKVVIREYKNMTDANRVATTLKSYGHDIKIIQKDSLVMLAVPFYKNISDSARVKDSLQRFFNFKTYLLH